MKCTPSSTKKKLICLQSIKDVNKKVNGKIPATLKRKTLFFILPYSSSGEACNHIAALMFSLKTLPVRPNIVSGTSHAKENVVQNV